MVEWMGCLNNQMLQSKLFAVMKLPSLILLNSEVLGNFRLNYGIADLTQLSVK